jgi:hypothetical protein
VATANTGRMSIHDAIAEASRNGRVDHRASFEQYISEKCPNSVLENRFSKKEILFRNLLSN